ncbi:hypothetical protein HYU40_02795 [Candidatus Woesearchaeota archaeon]|nr:hypothetical protein [Candidatus Woesearchaeota archaeon]
MNLVEEAFSRLFSGVEFSFEPAVSYSGKFKPYNATVRKIGSNLYFSLSRSWKGTSDEIVIGLIQHLLIKILRKEKFVKGRSKMASLNMQLYDDFIKGVSEVTVSNGIGDEALESSFRRVNEKYFLGFVDRPQLQWGSESFRKLASYDYHTNMITVSSLFLEAPERILDYLMYHEMLHKKLKFSSSNGRIRHHGSEFRRLEGQFDGSGAIEADLNSFIRSRRRARPQRIRRFSWRRLLMFQ